MKNHLAAYVFSLLLLVCAISLLVSQPQSGRFQMIAGGISLIGLFLNIMVFLHFHGRQ